MPVAVIRYQHDNHLGSASLELDATAQIISYEEYHPFGSTSYRSGKSETEVSLKRYKYVGKERDEETGLYYYGARYYAAWIGRFVSVDPLFNNNPNKVPYHYCSNNPITRIDPNGMNDNYGWYVDNEGNVIGKDTNDDNRIYLVVGNDASKVKSIGFKTGIPQKKLNDPVELPNFQEREILKPLYKYGLDDKTQEYGEKVYTINNTDKSVGILYKSNIETKMKNGNIKGSLTFTPKNKMPLPPIGEVGDSIYETTLKIIAHLHNIDDGKAHPPTGAADKLGNGARIGVVFDYEKEGHNVYIYNENTRYREKAVMKADVFFRPFVSPNGDEL